MNLTIRARLLLLAGVALTALTVQGGIALYALNATNSNVEEVATQWLPSVEASGHLRADLSRLRLRQASYLLSLNDPAENALSRKRLDDILAEQKHNMTDYAKWVSQPDEKAVYEDFVGKMTTYLDMHGEMMNLLAAGDQAAALELFQGKMRALNDDTAPLPNKLADMNTEGAHAAYTASQDGFHFTIIAMLSLLGGSLLVLGLLALTTVKSVSNGLQELVRAFSALAGLDLRVRAATRGKDEVGKTLVQFNTTADTLKGVVQGTQEAANSVAAAAHELSSGMESISAVTARQGDALHSIAAALEETSASAQEVNNKAQQSGHVTLQVVSAIEGVSNRVVQLKDNAERIGSVLGVIRGVSEQINLLSLNASIEAARAGDAGRGFAVVADEVKKLASSTSEHTDEIAHVVNLLQTSVKETNDALETAAASLEDVRSGSESVVAAVSQQTVAVNDISRTIGEFRDQMTSVMSNVQEAQTAALSLSAAAEQLNRQNAQFKI